MTRIWLIALAVVAITTWLVQDWRWGEKYTELQLDYEKEETAALRATTELARLQRSRSDNQIAATVEAVNAEKTTSRTITREVIRYVQAPPDPDYCLLSGEWVRIHNAAATGDLSAGTAASGATAGRSETITASAAIPVISENYNDCREDKQRVKLWQDYYNREVRP